MRQRTFSVATTLALATTLTWLGLFCAAPTRADQAAVGPMPWPNTRDYYPSKAKREGLSGRVGLECSVDEKGRAGNIVVLESGGPLFDDAAKRLFSDVHFRIPPDWSATGGPAKRFLYGVIFQFVGKPSVAPFEDNRRTVIITMR